MITANKMIGTAAFLGFLSVAFGAFGAHAIKDRVEPVLFEAYKTGIHYMQFHVLAIIAYGIWVRSANGFTRSPLPYYFFIAGIILFTGSLITLTLTGVRAFGAITPIGGLTLMLGWIIFSLQVWNHNG